MFFLEKGNFKNNEHLVPDNHLLHKNASQFNSFFVFWLRNLRPPPTRWRSVFSFSRWKPVSTRGCANPIQANHADAGSSCHCALRRGSSLLWCDATIIIATNDTELCKRWDRSVPVLGGKSRTWFVFAASPCQGKFNSFHVERGDIFAPFARVKSRVNWGAVGTCKSGVCLLNWRDLEVDWVGNGPYLTKREHWS